MKTVNKIMVAVDFSDYSLDSVKYAASLAMDVGAKLLLVNVINQRDVYMMEKIAIQYPAFTMEKYVKDTRQEREAFLQEYIGDSNCKGIEVKTNIRVGDPCKELLKEIQEKKADLLVMAAKGRSDFIDTVIGSCAKKMFRRSPIPVLSVRSQ